MNPFQLHREVTIWEYFTGFDRFSQTFGEFSQGQCKR